jgi:hypothetical protein
MTTAAPAAGVLASASSDEAHALAGSDELLKP